MDSFILRHFHADTTVGWYIPPTWFENASNDLRISTEPLTLLDAAELALELALHNNAYLDNSKIPLIVHQTLPSPQPATWPSEAKDSVEDWLELATSKRDPRAPAMAYLFWDDGGLDALIETYEPWFWSAFQRLPYRIEQADVSRVVALRWFGGVYADVDVRPLQHPVAWIQDTDVADWTEPETSTTHKMQRPQKASYKEPDIAPYNWRNLLAGIDVSHHEGIGAVFGLECDSDPAGDEYWRLGYTHPVQVTNWALAMAPTHPIARVYVELVAAQLADNTTNLREIDPLDLTGAPVLTAALQNYTEHSTLERPTTWNSLSGLGDAPGGRGKVLTGDLVVLPITAFSPGRSWFHNMGSQPVTHPSARLYHTAAASWREANLKVHAGKLCRKFFGKCKDWATMPEAEASAVPVVPELVHEAESA